MSLCETCKWAEWNVTASGRLHPNKGDRCGFKWELPPVPAAFYFIGKPIPCGGYIERGDRTKLTECSCWAQR